MPPRHVAVIMDGNGRWATARHLPRAAGHSRGVEAVRSTIETCAQRGVEYLTLFAFSSENWRRPADEVSLLMRLFVSSLQREVGRLVENGVRMRVVGQVDSLEPDLRRLIREAEQRTAANDRLNLTICASYGGRWDIVQAACALQERALRDRGAIEFDEQLFASGLALGFAPDPDLLIRTGGEQRISNFLLWQLAYTELYFTDVLWPDFSAEQLEAAFGWFARRERRFGRVVGAVPS
ncbi:MAG TPA: polyprenyl diphosphate synthase [Burkholderiaceae bacterium]|jgi:undecaprenyl diphosphate synthase|nr:polyprenyl diphosphate synthase [Burkholderiaceae bacterium]